MTATAHGMSRASGAGGVAHASAGSQESPPLPHNCYNADDNVDDFENARVSPAIAVAAAI